jgi:hypothetical protein
MREAVRWSPRVVHSSSPGKAPPIRDLSKSDENKMEGGPLCRQLDVNVRVLRRICEWLSPGARPGISGLLGGS